MNPQSSPSTHLKGGCRGGRDCLPEWIQVDDDEVDGLDLVTRDGVHVLLVVPDCEDPAVYRRVERLDPTVEHLGESRHILDLRKKATEESWVTRGVTTERAVEREQALGFQEHQTVGLRFMGFLIISDLLYGDSELLDGRGSASGGDDLKSSSVEALERTKHALSPYCLSCLRVNG